MSGFDADWLSLREPEDAKSRDATLLADLPHSEWALLRVVDLGAGTGNNLRYLAPRIRARQHWTLIDKDAELLAAAVPPPIRPAPAVESRILDLTQDLESLGLEGCGLLTASALIDLVSRDWLARLATLAANARVPACLFALSVDGHISWTPREPEDDEIGVLVGAHMQTGKGFGPALGPDCVIALAETFKSAGYRIRMGESPWCLLPAQVALQRALLEVYLSAAREMAPARAGEIAEWGNKRAAHIAAGASELIVGHRDVLALRGARNV